ncbi:MAG: serine/threonine protein kinase, partial [Planctomycetaceae bacterium]|nr:serine/threonine protein kinase [Planctomycetaceae bacterium]
RDVPAFDSVWIDALVHARKLTAFQAKVLESGHPEQLAVGPCVLVDQLGHGRSTTYLARHREGNERCVLKLIRVPEEQRGFKLEVLKQLVSSSEKLAHPSVITPKSCLAHHEDLVSVSRYLAGPSLSQLLVRRGRFPAKIVQALAKQLIDGLAALDERGLIHGDLRLENLRLSKSGRVVMLDAGIASAIHPQLNIHARISPDHYDGIAPELICTNNHADVRSEFYALGCVLWQLLAGRPPYPTGDPLAKLMAHQTRRVPDVREVAPDTPPELAEILRVFTDPDPNRRPPSFRAFRNKWGPPRRTHRRQISQFRAMFNTAIPHIPAMTPDATPNRWPTIAALIFLLSGASLSLMDAGAYSRLLAIPNRLQDYLTSSDPEDTGESEDEKNTDDSHLGQPFPAPDANGVIELTTAGPYRWSQINTVGPLTIKGTADTPTEIVMGTAACQFAAADVVLENLQFRQAPSQESKALDEKPPALLQVTSRSLIVRKCAFQLGSQSENENSLMRGIEWRHLDPNQPTGGRVMLENCLTTGSGDACWFQNWPRQIVVKNCLKIGDGVLLDFASQGQTGHNVQLNLSQVTLRTASGLLRCGLESPQTPGTWLIQATDCVFDLNQEPAAIFQAQGPAAPAFLAKLQMPGQQCLLNTTGITASWRSSDTAPDQPFDSANMNVEGIVLAKLQFAADPSNQPPDSKLLTWQGPRFSSDTPGIDPTKLPNAKTNQTAISFNGKP